MNKYEIIIMLNVLVFITTGIHAYNQEATQKLQEKIKNVKDREEIVKQPLIKEIEQLIQGGADPNVKIPMGFLGDADLIEFIVLMWQKNNDAAALENLFRIILDKGVHVAIDPDKPVSFAMVVENCPISVIKMVVNAGTDKQKIEKNMHAAIKIIEDLKKETEELTKVRQAQIQDQIKKDQEDIIRYQKLMDELKKPAKA
jgi:cell division protein ZapA (FtsZ GTPase activity inhibitor)